MKIGRTVPPAAAPLRGRDLWHGVIGACSAKRSLESRAQEIREAFGVSQVFLVSSGSAALTLTLRALKALAPDSRTDVVIPAYTCFSVPASILKTGLRPALCDINRSTFDFDHALLEQALTPRTLAVIVHHLFGVPSDVERVRAVCRARGIFVIEDAAQAMGAESNGHKLGTLGDAGIFSFGRGKNITCGSGGAIVTRCPRLAGALARQYRDVPQPAIAEVLKDFVTLVLMTIFIRPRLYWIPAALPFLRLGETIFPREIAVKRLSGMKAGLLRGWRARLDRSNRIRSDTTRYFSQAMPALVDAGAPHPCLRLPILAATANEKQRIYSYSKAHGLGLSVAYPTAVDEIPEVRAMVSGQQFPSAHRVAASLLTVPTHQWLTDKDKSAIANLWRESRSA